MNDLDNLMLDIWTDRHSDTLSSSRSKKIYIFLILPERGMLTKVLLPDFRLVGAVGVPIRVNYGPTVKTLRKG